MPNHNANIIAVIVAGGTGSRMGGAIPKQYQLLAGEPMLAHTLRAFANHPMISAVQVVIGEGHEQMVDSRWWMVDEKKSPATNHLPPTIGGATRQASVYNGLKAIAQLKPTHVLIHDAARACIDADTITRVCEALTVIPAQAGIQLKKNVDAAFQQHDIQAVIPAIPVASTLKRVAVHQIQDTIPRDHLYEAQTPQGFIFPLMYDLHNRAEGMEYTDDAAICESFGVPVHIVPGHRNNIKITTEEDMQLAEKLLAKPMENTTGSGFDVHAFTPESGDYILKLCGVDVPHTHGLVGHSDADVGLHALCDALLGAMGEGDIGDFFPPSDPQWKGADSSLFVTHIMEKLGARGGHVVNADITFICELPKIGPHKAAMKTRVANLLGIDPERVNIKATTTEGLGFTGRREGIAAQAVANVAFPPLSSRGGSQ